MNNIERKLAEEINSMPATDFEKIKDAFNKIQNCNLQDTKTDKYTSQKKIVPLYIKASCVAAAFALVFALWGYLNLMPYSYVEINMNQSIEISLNRLDKVMSVRSVNDDSDNIIANFKPSGNLDETIDGLLQLLDENNYIDNNDSILVTVQCNKNDRRQQIIQLVNQKIESYLNNHDKSINIISENINAGNTLKNESKKKDVSAVKLIIENNKTHNISENITPDNVIENSSHNNTTIPSHNKNDTQNYNKTALTIKEGKTEITTVYINSAKNSNNTSSAMKNAVNDNTTKNNQADTDFNLQNEKAAGKTPEIISADNTNDNSVNITAEEPTAKDNIKSEKKAESTDGTEKNDNTTVKDNTDNDTPAESAVTVADKSTTVIHSSGGGSKLTVSSDKDTDKNKGGDDNTISLSQAIVNALNNAGTTEEYADITKSEKDDDVYNIAFLYNNCEYNYKINIYSGEIIERKIKEQVTAISDEEALLAALADIGAVQEDIQLEKLEQKNDKFKIEFIYSGCQYSYEIDAYTSEILDKKIQEYTEAISDEKALLAALADIGAAQEDIQLEKLEQKDDKFKIEFIYSGCQYSYEIDAYTAEILDKKIQKYTEAISDEEALLAALADIGAAQEDIQLEKLEQKDDNFKIEFIYSGCQYSYEIDAYTAEILDKKVQEYASTISEQSAVLIALEDIGVTENEIELNEIENKEDEFKIVFVYNGIKYKYNIDAFTGEILKRKTDN